MLILQDVYIYIIVKGTDTSPHKRGEAKVRKQKNLKEKVPKTEARKKRGVDASDCVDRKQPVIEEEKNKCKQARLV